MNLSKYTDKFKDAIGEICSETKDGDNSQSLHELRNEFLIPYGLSIVIPSIAFVLICFPLVIVLSNLNGFYWSDILFFTNLPKEYLSHKYTIFPIPVSGSKIEYPLLLSLLTAYGTIGIGASVMIYSNSIFRLMVLSNGIYFGYYMVYLGVYLLSYFGMSSISFGSVNLFSLKLIYVFAIFYIFESFVDLFAKEGYQGDKYRFLFPGLHGLTTGWILEKEFNNGSSILNGIFFILCSFISIYVIETIITRLIKLLETHGLSTKYFHKYTKPKMYDGENILDVTKRSWRDEKTIIISCAFLNAIFPFFAYVLWKWLLVK